MSTESTNETESIETTTTVEDSMATESIEPGQTKSIESNELESIEPNQSQEESIDELGTTESNEPNASNKSTESTEESEDNKGGGLDVESTSSELNLSFDQDIFNDSSMVESETSDITSSVNGDSGVFFDSACEKQKSQKLPPLCIDVSIKI